MLRFPTALLLAVSIPLAACATSTADPDPGPPSEDDLGGEKTASWPAIDFTWSTGGPLRGKQCVRIYEPADTDGVRLRWTPTAGRGPYTFERAWLSDYLCTERDYGFRWSFAGPIAGMHCLAMNEPAEPAEHTWGDNYLCSPQDYHLSWSTHDPIPGQTCVRIYEPSDPHTWGDNYLCQARP